MICQITPRVILLPVAHVTLFRLQHDERPNRVPDKADSRNGYQDAWRVNVDIPSTQPSSLPPRAPAAVNPPIGRPEITRQPLTDWLVAISTV